MSIEKITLERVKDDWGACYARETPGRLESLYATPKTPQEVLTLRDGPWGDVPDKDRIWTLTRPNSLPAKLHRLFAAACAEKACQDAGWTDPRSLAAIQAARDFAEGKITAEELQAARAAAWRAAQVAVEEGAWAEEASRAAVASRAEEAAWVAAMAEETVARVARVAEETVARVARVARGRPWQVQTLLDLINKYETEGL